MHAQASLRRPTRAAPGPRRRSASATARAADRRAASGPNATRSRRLTGCPTASHIRLTWRLRPSWIVISSVSAEIRRTRAGAVRPSSSSTPSRSARSARSRTGGSADDRAVGLVDLEARVREPVGQLAVVGEQDQPGGVDVEPADRVQALGLGHQRDDGRTPLRVARGRDDAGRLVERVHDPLVDGRDRPAVDRDRVRRSPRRAPDRSRPTPPTVTRPARTISSDARREATPAEARYLARRICSMIVGGA